MTPVERRNAILQQLASSQVPLSASALAKKYQVSRQIIVGDIALLRAAQTHITATPRGYILEHSAQQTGIRRTIACCHTGLEPLRQELYTITDNGCAVLDVIVSHRVYGQLSGKLHIFSRYDADAFIRKVTESNSAPLSILTDGIHLHTLLCPDEDAFRRVTEQLRQFGILYCDDSDTE
ncbi:MAG: transcription repressor NadR [Oscillospiraceae bacterium]|nr:transcription repressor NadR [Oscillospiraceae bacterium]